MHHHGGDPDTITPEKVQSFDSVTLQQLCVITIRQSFDSVWATYERASSIAVYSRGFGLHDDLPPCSSLQVESSTTPVMETDLECYAPPLLPKSSRGGTRIDPETVENAEGVLQHFRFLQKLYSDLLLTELFRSCKLKENHLPFFIRKGITKINLQNFRQCCWYAVEKLLLDVGDSPTELSFARGFIQCSCNGNDEKHSPEQRTGDIDPMFYSYPNHMLMKDLPGDEITNIIIRMTNLSTLNLSFTCCTNENLATIAQYCPSLTSLNIIHCAYITDRGLRNLFLHHPDGSVTPIIQLRHLYVNRFGMNTGFNGITFVITHMPTIELVTYTSVSRILYNYYHQVDANRKFNLTYMEFAMFPRPLTVDFLGLCQTMCPRIDTLIMPMCQCDRRTLGLIAKFENLAAVDITAENDQMISLDELLAARGSKLRSLVVSNFHLTPSLLTRSCPKLRTMSMTKMTYAPEDSGACGVLGSVVEASLLFPNFTHEATALGVKKILLACTRIQRLKLTGAEPSRPPLIEEIFNRSKPFVKMGLEIAEDEFRMFPYYPKVLYVLG